MARLVDNIADYLEDQEVGTVGTDIFVGIMPETKDGISIADTGGYEPDADIPTATPTFQVYIRKESYDAARDLAGSVVDELHQLANSELQTDGITAWYILMIGEPNYIGRDEKDRDEFTINFRAKYAR